MVRIKSYDHLIRKKDHRKLSILIFQGNEKTIKEPKKKPEL